MKTHHNSKAMGHSSKKTEKGDCETVVDRRHRLCPSSHRPDYMKHGPVSRTSTTAHWEAGHSCANFTASSLEQSRRKKPPTISLASAKGPSVEVRFPFFVSILTASASDLSAST